MGVGATVGLAAKGLLPDSSIPTAATAGPSTSVQNAPLKAAVSEQRIVDNLSQTVAGAHDGGVCVCVCV